MIGTPGDDCAELAIIAYGACVLAYKTVVKACLKQVAIRTGACLAPCVLICVLPGGWFACPACIARCALLGAAGSAACLAAGHAAGLVCLATLKLALEECGIIPQDILPIGGETITPLPR